jgi:hypothetical protein
MNPLTRYELDAVDWPDQRVIEGRDGADIPGAVDKLMAARSEADAEAAYWMLDNRVVVQGQLFEAALPLVPVLLAALTDPLPAFVRVHLADLLIEITRGTPDETELARGNSDLAERIKRAARAGLWLIYSLCFDPNPQVRERGLFLAHATDPDRDRLGAVIEHALHDHAQSVRAVAGELSRSRDCNRSRD